MPNDYATPGHDLTRNAWQFTSAMDGAVRYWLTEATARRLARDTQYGGLAEPMGFLPAGDLDAVPFGC